MVNHDIKSIVISLIAVTLIIAAVSFLEGKPIEQVIVQDFENTTTYEKPITFPLPIEPINELETGTSVIVPASKLITLIDVDESGTKCIIEVDGISKIVSEGETATINNVTLRVFDAVPAHSAGQKDYCEVLIL